MINLIKDAEKHDKVLNEKEIEIISNIEKYLENISERIENFKKNLDKLKEINFTELFRRQIEKYEELEVIKNLYKEHTELTKDLNEITILIIKLYSLTKKEIF